MPALSISKKGLVVKIVLVIAVIAVFLLADISKDFVSYEAYFFGVRNDGLLFALESRFEPLFMAVTLVVALIVQNDLIVYSLFAMVALWIKIYVIRQLAVTWSILALIILFYGARFYPLFELTQIRVALATSFIFLAFLMVTKGQGKSAFLLSIVSVGFHYSSFVFLPFIFLRKWSFWSVIVLFFFILLVLIFTKDYILEQLSVNFAVIKMYAHAGFGNKVNPLAITVILDLVMISIGLTFWRYSSQLMRHVLAMQLVGVAFFYGLFDFGVLAHRFREMISVMWVFYLAHALQRRRVGKYYFYVLLIANIVLYAYLYFYHNPLFQKELS